MLDRSLLGKADIEFVVVSDTHSMLPPGQEELEKESRRYQTERAERALKMISTLDPSFVVHLGDLVQEFPDMPGFEDSMRRARETMERFGINVCHVAGNHDVGDKPDPTMPTEPVTLESLEVYHSLIGPSWYSWDFAGWHFVVLNSQILNSGLEAEYRQRYWLETDLSENVGKPTVMFLHLAPFLHLPREPSIGHYDNIAEPARSWLIDLWDRHDVRLVFCGHSHFQFVNQIGSTRIYVTPSPSFTRPGFSEIFSSEPPPEQGRDDTAKLGFFLVRIVDEQSRIHLIRTMSNTETVAAPEEPRVVSLVSRDLPRSPLAINARHPLSQAGQVPVAWPSMIRQQVRNDYPLLSCSELGARWVRVPAADLSDPVQRARLALLREDDLGVIAVWIWSSKLDLVEELARVAELVDTAEILIPGTLTPEPHVLQSIISTAEAMGVSASIAPLIAREIVPGKQHARTRIGFRLQELRDLDDHLRQCEIRLLRVVVRVDPDESPWDTMEAARSGFQLRHIDAVDWLVEMATTNEYRQVVQSAEAMFAALLQPESRIVLDPLVDLDRTMDVTLGLLDRQSNPRPVFDVVRLMNSILFGSVDTIGAAFSADVRVTDSGRVVELSSESHRFALNLPQSSSDGPATVTTTVCVSGDTVLRVTSYDLVNGNSTAIAD